MKEAVERQLYKGFFGKCKKAVFEFYTGYSTRKDYEYDIATVQIFFEEEYQAEIYEKEANQEKNRYILRSKVVPALLEAGFIGLGYLTKSSEIMIPSGLIAGHVVRIMTQNPNPIDVRKANRRYRFSKLEEELGIKKQSSLE
ncbi:hypothetical protein GOV14_03115 [Candidatus Pacearchaeota archaeon]|nr:hypothetical protein [Candidatus Pacearchaeota archaeon]